MVPLTDSRTANSNQWEYQREREKKDREKPVFAEVNTEIFFQVLDADFDAVPHEKWSKECDFVCWLWNGQPTNTTVYGQNMQGDSGTPVAYHFHTEYSFM